MYTKFIQDTIAKIARGDYSKEELSAFLKELDGLDEASFIQVYNQLYQVVSAQQPGKIEESFKASLESRLNNLHVPANTPVISLHSKRKWIKWTAAAAIIIFLAGGLYWVSTKKASSVTGIAGNKIKSGVDITPGGNHATLTLANGTTIILDQAKDGDLVQQGSVKIIKLDSGRLAYYQLGAKGHSTATGTEMVYNTISTPRAGQYHIILPDGTEAWLNSASSLRFPTSFSGNSREVQLTGEGYFEVIKNKSMPFIVNLGQAKITVLGTHFNINAYNDESTINSTLLEGAIKFTASGSLEKILSPGQQAVYDNGANSVFVRNADIEQVVAWKNGFFEFNNMDLPTIMRQISRWYDVDIGFETQYPDKRFGGRISRKLNLSSVVNMLETNGVHFKLENRKLTVID